MSLESKREPLGGALRLTTGLSGALLAAPHPTWLPHGASPRASGNACRRAPEVMGGPAPCRGLCGAADALALSIPGELAGRPWRCGSGARASAFLGHGQLRRGTAAPLSALLPAWRPRPRFLSHPDSGPPASFSSHLLPVPSFPAPRGPFHPDPGIGRALVFSGPTLALAWPCLSYHDPGLASFSPPPHPRPSP